jgi:hypothetical protein
MKLSKITVASLLAVGSASSFAVTAPVDFCKSAVNAEFASKCAPALTFYIAGSSALGGSIKSVVHKYFDTTVRSYFEVIDNGSVNGIGVANTDNGGKAGQGVTAWYGMSNPDLTGTSNPLFIVYNSFNGAAACVSKLIAPKIDSIAEATVVKVGPDLKTKTPAACTAYTTAITPWNDSASKAPTVGDGSKVVCTTVALLKADIAISDVDVPELAGLQPAAAKATLTAFTREPLAMQGFGVAVNDNLYKALQTAQLSSSCVGVYSEACQPSISKAQYASLVSAEGSIKSAVGLGVGTPGPLRLIRRDDLSGTQASSNMFFLNNSCNKVNATNARAGALTPINKTSNFTDLLVKEEVQTSGVETELNKTGTTDGYAIGVLTLAKAQSSSTNATAYKFVKLDGASPNFAKGGTSTYKAYKKADDGVITYSTLRNNMLDGSWPFQMAAFAVYPTKAVGADAKTAPKAGLIKAMVRDLSSPLSADLDAIGYFTGGTGKETMVSRAANINTWKQINKTTPDAAVVRTNNCAPLIFQDNQVNKL